MCRKGGVCSAGAAVFLVLIFDFVAGSNDQAILANLEDIMAATSQQLEQLRQQADSQSWGSHCDTDWTCGTPLRSDPAFFNLTEGRSLPSNISFVESRQLGGSHAALAVHNRWRLDCAVQRLGAQWRMNYDGVRGSSSSGSGTTPPEGPLATPGSILTQYFTQNEFAMWDKGTALSASTSLQTYPALVNNPRQVANLSCAVASPGTSGEYVAMQRPWYVAARSSPKDVVILIDVAGDRGTDAELRLQQMQATAVALLRGLSWTDFVAVVPYDEVANLTVSPVMVRASVRNVEALVAKVQGLTVSTEQSLHSCLGSAVWAAASLLYSGNVQNNTGSTSPTRRDPSKGKMQDGHRDTNATSSCTRAIVILSDGVSGIPVPEPVDVLLKGQISDAIVFGFAFKPEASSLTEAVDDIKEEQEAQADVYMKDTSSSGLSGSFASAAEESSSNYEGENSRRKASKVLASSNQIAALACGTNGVYRVAYSSPIDHNALANTFFGYFNALVEDIHGEPRWTEVYEDAFGQGLVASLSWPVYDAYDAAEEEIVPRPNNNSNNLEIQNFANTAKQLTGVLSMDIPLSNLSDNGYLSLEAVSDALLADQEVCDPISHQLTVSAEKTSSLSNTEKCLAIPGESIPLAEQKVMYGFLSFLIPMGAFWIPAVVLWGALSQDYQRGRKDGCVLAVNFAVLCVCLTIALPIFWTHVWPTIVQHSAFVPVQYTVVAQTTNPYRCCGTTNCKCKEAPRLPYCWTLRSDLEEGSCDNGYFCCQEESYDCNCHDEETTSGSGSSKTTTSTTVCDTCYRCIEHVNHRYCETKCGTCYSPVATVNFKYEQLTVISHLAAPCSDVFSSHTCLANFQSAHPVGSAHDAWVDPRSPATIVESIDWEYNYYVPFMIFAVFSGISILLNWLCALPIIIAGLGQCISRCASDTRDRWDREVARQRLRARDRRERRRERAAAREAASINDEGSLLSSSANASMTTYGGGNRTAAEIREPPAASLTRTSKTTNSPAPPPPPAYMARPAPPPAPKSEHTLGLPSVHSSEGHLPPPPAY